MRRQLVSLIAFALIASACAGTATAAVETGGEVFGDLTNDAAGGLVAPDFTFVLHDGTTWRLSDQNEPVLVVFWADW